MNEPQEAPLVGSSVKITQVAFHGLTGYVEDIVIDQRSRKTKYRVHIDGTLATRIDVSLRGLVVLDGDRKPRKYDAS